MVNYLIFFLTFYRLSRGKRVTGIFEALPPNPISFFVVRFWYHKNVLYKSTVHGTLWWSREIIHVTYICWNRWSNYDTENKPIVSLQNFDMDKDYFKFSGKYCNRVIGAFTGLKYRSEIRGMRPCKLIRYLRFYYRLL